MPLNCGAGEDSWESLGLQGDPTIHPKGDQSWMFIGRTDVEPETPILWPPDVNSWLIGKDPDAGKAWRQEEKGTTQDEMVGWHHRLDGHEFEPVPGVGDGQAGLVCCSPWGHKDLDRTEQLKDNKDNDWTEDWTGKAQWWVFPSGLSQRRCTPGGELWGSEDTFPTRVCGEVADTRCPRASSRAGAWGRGHLAQERHWALLPTPGVGTARQHILSTADVGPGPAVRSGPLQSVSAAPQTSRLLYLHTGGTQEGPWGGFHLREKERRWVGSSQKEERRLGGRNGRKRNVMWNRAKHRKGLYMGSKRKRGERKKEADLQFRGDGRLQGDGESDVCSFALYLPRCSQNTCSASLFTKVNRKHWNVAEW